MKFYPFLPDGTPLDPRNINHLRDYILYAGVLDINNKRNFDYFLQANVHILNKMDWKDINYDSLVEASRAETAAEFSAAIERGDRRTQEATALMNQGQASPVLAADCSLKN